MATILIVDDVPAMCEQYAYDLKRLGGYETLIANGGAEALEQVKSEPVDCLILDLEMPGIDGFEVLRTLERQSTGLPVIVYTGTGNYERCVRAVKLGAFGFIDKSEPMERVVQEIENALERRRLTAEVKTLKQRLGDDCPIIGSSPAIEKLKTVIGRLAPIPSTVLIVGESGSGKELVARELHHRSNRAQQPFLTINAAALPENLIESELFGHEVGAFTGASRMRKGAFEVASRGTLFLDEIAELPLAAQAKLLRILEDQKVSRLGGTRQIPVDTRVVTATNRDLELEISSGRFRQDLYYRINVHIVKVPPLREHREDIPKLLEFFLKTTCQRFGMRLKQISPGADDLLQAHDWRQNNVRELRNVVERMVIACDGKEITPQHIPAEVREAAVWRPGGAGAVRDATAELRTEAEPPEKTELPAVAEQQTTVEQSVDRGLSTHAAVPVPEKAAKPVAAWSKTRTLKELKVEAERSIILAALERNNWQITKTAAELGLADHSSLLKIMRRHKLRR